MDHWPSSAQGAPSVVAHNGIPATATGGVTGVLPPAAAPANGTVVPSGGGPVTHSAASGALPGAALATTGADTAMMTGVLPASLDTATGQVQTVGPDTGVQPAVPSPPVRRRRGAPIVLRAVVAVVAVLVVLGVAGLVVNHYRPSWLHHLGINPSSATPSGSTPTTAGSSTTTPAPPALTVGPATASGVTFTVRAPSYTVNVKAVGGDAWVEATSGSGATQFAGILPAGTLKSFPNQQQFTLDIGSKAATVSVTRGSKLLGVYVPSVAPYTLTFHSVPATT